MKTPLEWQQEYPGSLFGAEKLLIIEAIQRDANTHMDCGVITPDRVGPHLVWRSSRETGSCVSCRRDSEKVLEISPRYNGGFVMRMCPDCIRDVAATLGMT